MRARVVHLLTSIVVRVAVRLIVAWHLTALHVTRHWLTHWYVVAVTSHLGLSVLLKILIVLLHT